MRKKTTKTLPIPKLNESDLSNLQLMHSDGLIGSPATLTLADGTKITGTITAFGNTKENVPVVNVKAPDSFTWKNDDAIAKHAAIDQASKNAQSDEPRVSSNACCNVAPDECSSFNHSNRYIGMLHSNITVYHSRIDELSARLEDAERDLDYSRFQRDKLVRENDKLRESIRNYQQESIAKTNPFVEDLRKLEFTNEELKKQIEFMKRSNAGLKSRVTRMQSKRRRK